MNGTTHFEAPEDPRGQVGFQPEHYPKSNGKAAPAPDATERNERIMIDFLAVYYDLNRGYAELLKARANPKLEDRTTEERTCLQAIERALLGRDRVEDCYAPFGVIAEPLVENGFTVDVKFRFGNVDAAGKLRSDIYTLTTYVPIPCPADVKLEELPIKIEGPGINPE